MDGISEDLNNSDFSSALTKVTTKLGSKLTDKGRQILSDLKEKITNLQENPPAEQNPCS